MTGRVTANAASPFARQLAMQGAPTLFGQPSRPSPPLPQRPSALGQMAPPTVPDMMASPFSAGADSRGFVAAQQALLAQATAASVDGRQGSVSSGKQQSSCNGASASPDTVNAAGEPMTQPPEDMHCKNGAASSVSGKTGRPVDTPTQEPMGINELAVLSKRPKRQPVQQHRLAEVMAALDAKGSSRPNSFTGSALSARDHSSPAPQANASLAGFPKAVSDGCEGSQIAMSTLMGGKAVSQSVPELTQQGSDSGIFASMLT